jgi:hypothetical protein
VLAGFAFGLLGSFPVLFLCTSSSVGSGIVADRTATKRGEVQRRTRCSGLGAGMERARVPRLSLGAMSAGRAYDLREP